MKVSKSLQSGLIDKRLIQKNTVRSYLYQYARQNLDRIGTGAQISKIYEGIHRSAAKQSSKGRSQGSFTQFI
jgi:hypothetical protein